MICHLVWNVNRRVVNVKLLLERDVVELLPLIFHLLDSVAIFVLRVLLVRKLLSFLIFGTLMLLSYMKKNYNGSHDQLHILIFESSRSQPILLTAFLSSRAAFDFSVRALSSATAC